MKRNTILLFLIVALTGCISDFDINSIVDSNENALLVVEGDIISGTRSTFTLSKTYRLDEDRPAGYNDVSANVCIVGSDGSRSENATYTGNGVYVIDVENLKENVEYALEIKYEEETYLSTFSVPYEIPEALISFDQPEEYGEVSIRISTGNYSSNEHCYYMWKYTEDWEVVAPYATDIFFDPINGRYNEDKSLPYQYCWSTYTNKDIVISTTESLNENRIVNFQLRQYPSSSRRIAELYRIRVKQFRISKAAYEYYQEKKKLDEDLGGLFSPQPSELIGNINCTTNPNKKAIGYVSVFNNLMERELYIFREELTLSDLNLRCDLMPPNKVGQFLQENDITSITDFYYLGYRPLYANWTDNGLQPSYWTQEICADCRAGGGSKNRPTDWPNDHY